MAPTQRAPVIPTTGRSIVAAMTFGIGPTKRYPVARTRRGYGDRLRDDRRRAHFTGPCGINFGEPVAEIIRTLPEMAGWSLSSDDPTPKPLQLALATEYEASIAAKMLAHEPSLDWRS